MSRYFTRKTARNRNKQYKKLFDERGVKHIKQFRTPIYAPVDNLDLLNIETVEYIFQQGDAFWKLSEQAYGDPKFWWVIASFNRTPTLAHLKPGDIVKIPVDLSQALEILE